MDGAQINIEQIINALVTEVLIPEIAHLFSKGTKTEAEARAELESRATASIARAKAFLEQTKPTDEDTVDD